MDDIIIPNEAQPYQLRALLGQLSNRMKELKRKVIDLKLAAGNAETKYKRELNNAKILHRDDSKMASVVNALAENEEKVKEAYDDWQVKLNIYDIAKGEYEVLIEQNRNIKQMLDSALDEFYSEQK